MKGADTVARTAKRTADTEALTKAQLDRMVRITPVKRLRIELGLSQVEFAERFHIPVGTLRDWEQRRYEPDQAAQAYLKVISADAAFVARALAAA